jgi:peptidyl-prolyl cis-trans isomerase SurA
MKYVLALTLMMIATLGAHGVRAAENVAGIAAVVNDEAISMSDVAARMKLVMVSSGIPNNPEIRAKIMPQVVEGLIEEQLKLQEAKRNKLEVTEEEVQEGLKVIAQQNKYEPEQFSMLLEKAGVPKKTLLNQIKAQLAWNKVVKEILHRRVDVSETDVDVRLERMKEKIGQTEYLVAQIFLPLDNPKRNAETEQFAGRMAKELQAKKAPFGPVAAQFSKAAGAENGGSLGWIQQGQLGEDLDKVLLTLQEGQVSDPIKTQGGLYLLNLQKKRTLTETSIPPRDELTNMIGFERLDRVQQRALLDLKSAAFIDRRV